jgi:serine/threonine protein kinase
MASRRMLFGSGSATGLSLSLIGLVVKGDNPSIVSSSDKLNLMFEEIRAKFSQKWLNHFPPRKILDSSNLTVADFKFGNCINKGCNAVVYEANLVNEEETREPFAVKMMFNYEAETNAGVVWNAMKKECIIFPGTFGELKTERSLRHHPCIAEVVGAFVDHTPLLPEALKLYPNALPRRLYDAGYGRNMTLFLVMKKYDQSLRDFLLDNLPDVEVSLKILTQMFEAVSFLVDNQIVHRDIKSDNFLVDISRGTTEPVVVLSDFGCCFTDLQMYFPSSEMSRGGNVALMAPEVATAVAGPFSYIDYSRADLWSVATLAYEVFHQSNPFYGLPNRERLYSSCYTENQLPSLPKQVPPPLRSLIKSILNRNPKKRPSPRVASTVCHIELNSKRLIKKRKTDVYKILNEIFFMESCSSKTSSLISDLRLLFFTQVTSKDLSTALEFFSNK